MFGNLNFKLIPEPREFSKRIFKHYELDYWIQFTQKVHASMFDQDEGGWISVGPTVTSASLN